MHSFKDPTHSSNRPALFQQAHMPTLQHSTYKCVYVTRKRGQDSAISRQSSSLTELSDSSTPRSTALPAFSTATAPRQRQQQQTKSSTHSKISRHWHPSRATYARGEPKSAKPIHTATTDTQVSLQESAGVSTQNNTQCQIGGRIDHTGQGETTEVTHCACFCATSQHRTAAVRSIGAMEAPMHNSKRTPKGDVSPNKEQTRSRLALSVAAMVVRRMQQNCRRHG
jgi:hypothetical protein